MNAMLILEDGRSFHGQAFGAIGHAVAEVCFNTSMSGYQEILSDPSYTDQIICFTTPHIGNVGVNADDMESKSGSVRGLIIRQVTRQTSSYRAQDDLQTWLVQQNIVGISDIDTRALTRHLRTKGALRGVIVSDDMSEEAALELANSWEGLNGRDLVATVSTKESYVWTEGKYDLDEQAFFTPEQPYHVVALDFGCKDNILRLLADRGCRITVLPCTASAQDVFDCQPDGIFLSNGPGDPSAVPYAVKTIQALLEQDIPIFGICMGHQLLSQALGLTTFKLKFGHRGGNHPVRHELTKKIDITSQNHGYAVNDDDLDERIEITHRSLFDGTVEGLRLRDKAVFSVQYHPEASPGPQDAEALFDQFVASFAKA
ncbi:MAG: glutamine-hydrolyzing carbamoyl-phosphate synthase small subunit [Mariprofundaceae bacterium]|nr:glutamine-hydrolyzing carbamoyl-phosphate synthase small subunit [Mariprofundaceae bacterium]